MNKNILSIGVIILIIISSFSPLVFGFSIKISDEKEQTSKTLPEPSQINNHIWPMNKNDAQKTGRSPYNASQNNGGEKWKYFTESSIWGAATIDKDGILYIGTPYDELHAVYPNGTKKWKANLEGREYQSPSIAPDGTIYVGTTDRFYAFYPNGTLKWIFNKSGNYFSEPVIDSNGTVYVGTQDGMVYAIYSNGTMKWEYYVADYIFNIALDHNENVYFGGPYTNSLFCFYPNGTLKWRYKYNNDLYNSPVIDDNGIIYANFIHKLVALYPNGTEKWIVDFNEMDCYGDVSIAPNRNIILTDDDYISALNPNDGSIIWQYKIFKWPLVGHVSTAAISGDGTIYFAYDAWSDCIAYLTSLNSDGSLKWETSLTTDILPYDYVHIISEPSIDSDGTVYITSCYGRGGSNYTDFGYIHAIGMENPIAPESPTIIGPSKVKLLQKYEYNLSCNISTGGDVYYFIDWDDEKENVVIRNNWIGPYLSEEMVTVNHSFEILGKHTIKVRAKGNDSLCSTWGYFDVKVGLGKSGEFENFNIFLKLIKQSLYAFPILRHLLT